MQNAEHPTFPGDLIQLVYVHDPAYKEIFGVVLREMMLHRQQEGAYTDFIVDQERERNHFALCAGRFLHRQFT